MQRLRPHNPNKTGDEGSPLKEISMRYLLASCALLMLSGNAFASGGIWCETEAAPAAINVHGGVSRGMGGQLFSFEGKVSIADQALPENLRKLEFAQEHVTQYWFDGESVNLVLYREWDINKLFSSIEISIETKANEGDDEEGSYTGSYKVMISYTDESNPDGKQVDLTGAIDCSAD
jgi:hypothetical protein